MGGKLVGGDTKRRPAYWLVGGRLAIDFANTFESPSASQDGLRTWEGLVEFFVAAETGSPSRRAGLLELAATAPKETAAVVELAHSMRDALRLVLAARADGNPLAAEWIAPINAVLRTTEGHDWLEGLEGQGERDWRLTLRARSEGLEWLLAAIARSAGELIAEGPSAPVRRCANPKCGLYFYDDSRTGKRRWCSMARCGNRAKVAAHFRRTKKIGHGETEGTEKRKGRG